MIIKLKTITRDQNGGAVVEFALILPLLIMLLFGIIEFGLLLYNKQIITNACREGARYGIVMRIPRITNDEIKDKIKDYAQDFLVTFGSDILDDADIDIASPDDNDDTNGACVCSDPDATTDERCLTTGCDLVIDATYNYNFLVLSAFGFGPTILHSKTTMKME